jgi:hypothetical protein
MLDDFHAHERLTSHILHEARSGTRMSGKRRGGAACGCCAPPLDATRQAQAAAGLMGLEDP